MTFFLLVWKLFGLQYCINHRGTVEHFREIEILFMKYYIHIHGIKIPFENQFYLLYVLFRMFTLEVQGEG